MTLTKKLLSPTMPYAAPIRRKRGLNCCAVMPMVRFELPTKGRRFSVADFGADILKLHVVGFQRLPGLFDPQRLQIVERA